VTRAVLFDFDLTLADSTRAIVECFTHAFARMELPRPRAADVAKTIGVPLPQAFVTLTGDATPHAAQLFVKRFIERADEVMANLTTMMPHTVATVHALRAGGIRTAIVSTKFRYRIIEILELRQLKDAFDVVIGGEDVSEHKPHPEGLRLALQRLEVEPHDAVYVGDHPVDAQAAAGAKLDFIAVLTGVAVREDFSSCMVRQFLDSLEMLPRIVAARGYAYRDQ
jgi:phosphoglycolate phosphatase